MAEDQVKIKKEQASAGSIGCCSDGNHYPWGTSLRFQDELLDELGIEALATGDIVEVRGFAFVDSKSEHSSADHSEKSISIQMTSIKVHRDESDHAEQLYGPES